MKESLGESYKKHVQVITLHDLVMTRQKVKKKYMCNNNRGKMW